MVRHGVGAVGLVLIASASLADAPSIDPAHDEAVGDDLPRLCESSQDEAAIRYALHSAWDVAVSDEHVALKVAMYRALDRAVSETGE